MARNRNQHVAPNQMSLLTQQQYALPIHNGNGPAGHGYYGHSNMTPRPEHALRRKTPNGTLNAGYDGAAEDVNPNKHQVVPLGNAPSSVRSQPSFQPPMNIKRTFAQHQQHQQQQHQGWQGFGAPAWPPGPSTFPVMDSMLQQMPGHHHQQFYGVTVPSVIGPPYQYLGPTASGLQSAGPYGPYWPNGTFVPYRPAAVRDPRFYHDPASVWSGPLPNPHFAQHPEAWSQQNSLGQPQWFQGQGLPPMGGQGLAELPPQQVFTPAQHVGPYTNVLPSLSGHQSIGQPCAVLQPQPRSEVQMVGDRDSGVPRVPRYEEYGSLSPNGRQRDATFAWALQQYRELLAFLHQTRKQQHNQQQYNHPTRQPASHQTMPGPSFYPRPPVPSRSGLTLKTKRRKITGAVHHPTRSDLDGSCRDSTNSACIPTATDDDFDMERPRSNSMRTPAVSHDVEHAWHSGRFQPPQQRPWPDRWQQRTDRFDSLRPCSGSSVVASAPFHDNSPLARAAVALQQMTKMCQDTEWQWTDGMQLAGCLAYGLGQYPKALWWYTNVLEMDRKHLEARSNLAATLLALGRRQDAEQHWITVVKAAPNHFEAVEHLIGMLCNDQRSRAAIRVIEHVERSLRLSRPGNGYHAKPLRESSAPCALERAGDAISFDFADGETFDLQSMSDSHEPGFGSSGFAIPGCDNGRILALIHAKGNMLYGLANNVGAARAFEDAVLIAAGRNFDGIQGLVGHILTVVSRNVPQRLPFMHPRLPPTSDPILLSPEEALSTAKLCFPFDGELPGLRHVTEGMQRRAVISTTSNSLLSLAKIFQDGMSNSGRGAGLTPLASGVRDILALYYLSLSLQPSPSTANNVGILLASVQQTTPVPPKHRLEIPGVVPGSGIALALQYYHYGLQLDQNHAHLYTNLGSLLKDIGQLDAAVNMYERAVKCDGKFDIALANLANAVKDKGRINDAIEFYQRAVKVSPDFAEAVCGLANALNSICSWKGRGGVAHDGGRRDRWHVDESGMFIDARQMGVAGSGWIQRVVDIVETQLVDGETWGMGCLTPPVLDEMAQQLTMLDGPVGEIADRERRLRRVLQQWAGQKWEGARIARLVERGTKRIGWHWYRDRHITKKERAASSYKRPQLPATLTVPAAPTVLPFHTFTCPVSAKQIRLISQRNGYRISVSTLRAPWLPQQVYPPPDPPAPWLRVGYVSSDFNNHPLAHLMQSVFGLHDPRRVRAYCYATTASDGSVHRQQIQTEAPVFYDASSWPTEKLVRQIVDDHIHILVNLNGYTRGARNEVFAARPAPVQMSFMGFAGTLGAEWCDYLLADEMAVPPSVLRPWRGNVDLEDCLVDGNCGAGGAGDANDEWVYGENIIYCRDTFFCCDHKQSAPDAHGTRVRWDEEQALRWRMRQELFPELADETVIFANFNQLYKVGLRFLRCRSLARN